MASAPGVGQLSDSGRWQSETLRNFDFRFEDGNIWKLLQVQVQILDDGSPFHSSMHLGWERTLYPSCRDGSPFTQPLEARDQGSIGSMLQFWLRRHQLMGPDAKGHGRNWTECC